jgi:hypothetical protein
MRRARPLRAFIRSVRNMSSAQSVVIRKYETVKTFP